MSSGLNVGIHGVRLANHVLHLGQRQAANFQRRYQRQRQSTILAHRDRIADRRRQIALPSLWHLEGRHCIHFAQHAFDVDAQDVAGVQQVLPRS
jgi:hypothetical protein